MIEGMKRVLSGEEVQDKGKKPVKPQDLARLYETIIQVPFLPRKLTSMKVGKIWADGQGLKINILVNLKSDSALLYNKGHNLLTSTFSPKLL